MVTSGFFNSVLEDRLYDAENFNSIFSGIIRDGVLSTVGDAFTVTPALGAGLNILVNPGRAWCNNSWIDSTSPVTLAVSAPHPLIDRYDTVVLDFNKEESVRENSIILIPGTPNPPALINTDLHKQLRIAQVRVPAGALTIHTADITYYVGTQLSPYASGMLQQVSIDGHLARWDDEFNTWFDSIRDVLNETPVSHIQAELDDINTLPIPNRNILINGAMLVHQQPNDNTTFDEPFGYYPGPDMWKLDGNHTTGVYRSSHEVDGNGVNWYKISVVTGLNTDPAATRYFRFLQRIEGERLGALNKGLLTARNMVLSFKVKTNLVGTYNVELADIHNGRHVVFQYNITNTTSETNVVIDIPRDLSGPVPNNQTVALEVRFWLGAGSSFRTGTAPNYWTPDENVNRAPNQVHLGRTTGNYWQITEVQLTAGNVHRDFEQRSYDEELTACQRYYEVLEGWGIVAGESASGGWGVLYDIRFRTPKRYRPSIEFCDIWIKRGGTFDAFASPEQVLNELPNSGDLLAINIRGFTSYIQAERAYAAKYKVIVAATI